MDYSIHDRTTTVVFSLNINIILLQLAMQSLWTALVCAVDYTQDSVQRVSVLLEFTKTAGIVIAAHEKLMFGHPRNS